MTSPLKLARCHPERPNYQHGRCRECDDKYQEKNVSCPHGDRQKTAGRCSTCMSRYYWMRRRAGVGDALGTVRASRTLRHIEDPELRKKLVTRKRTARMYGLSLDDYERLLEKQGGLCAICREEPKNGRELTIDHNHKCCKAGGSCGKCVRGLLCHGCNMRLGQLESDLVQRSLDYLAEHKRQGEP